MFRNFVVPVDGSPASFDALPVAARMANEIGGTVELVAVHNHADVTFVNDAVERELQRLRPTTVKPCRFVMTGESVADAITDIVRSRPKTTVVMSSHGHGRSAIVLGSTTNDVLRAVHGPIVVVGPNCDIDRAGTLSGSFVVPVDGSPRTEAVLPIVAAWAVEFGGTPWLVHATTEPEGGHSYLDGLARQLRHEISAAVEFAVLHDEHAACAILAFAESTHASSILLSTHGRTGLALLRSGSVASEVVRRARCPVLMIRPPGLVSGEPSRLDSHEDRLVGSR